MARLFPLGLLTFLGLLLPALSQQTQRGSRALSELTHVTLVSSKQLDELIKSPHVTVVFYFIRDSPTFKSFFEEYDKSARYLQAYNVKLAVFDCVKDNFQVEKCQKEKVDRDVYTYQNGVELLTLEIVTMFDVNSIMSNVLQLVLLHDVPIIQSRLERHTLQSGVIGQHDIVFAYPVSFGTPEHRIFMEIAYTFRDRFNFALTTVFKTLERLQDSATVKPTTRLAMWVLFCSETTQAEISESGDCHNIRYHGEASLAGLALFMKSLSEKMLFHAPADGVTELLNLSDMLPTIYLYTNAKVAPQTELLIQAITFELRGLTKVVVVDMDSPECQALAEQQGHDGKLPAVAVRLTDGSVTFMADDVETSVENVHDFLVKFVYPPEMSDDTVEVVYSTDLDTADDSSSLIEEVESQDDHVAEAVFRMQQEPMSLDLVPALTKATFYTTVKQADLLMVLFFLPFDHVSMAFLRNYGYAANILAKNFSDDRALARVNCYDATDLCGAENITTYPVLRIYQQDREQLDYKGSLDRDSVVKAYKLQQVGSPVDLSSAEEVEKFIKGEHPVKFEAFTPSSVLLLASEDKSSDVENLFRETARSLSIITAFAVVRGDVAKTMADQYNIPLQSVLAHHRQDPHKPFRSLTGPFTATDLQQFVKQSIITAVPELTMMNFPTLYAMEKPFAILFLDLSDPVSDMAREMFAQIAMLDQLSNALFCWMNAQAKTIGLKILSEYTWTATLPMVTVVDHRQGQVFNYQAEQLKQEEVTEWLTRVVAEEERPSRMLEQGRWVAPGRFYDFLAYVKKQEGLLEDDTSGNRDEAFEEHDQDSAEDLSSDLGDPEESLRVDSEIREELLELQNSRLYHHSPDRRKQQAGKQESGHGHSHTHTEL